MVVLAGFLSVSVLAFGSQDADGSGEALLRSWLQRFGGETRVEVMADRVTLTPGVAGYEYEGPILVQGGGRGQARVVYNDMWGDGFRVVTDGRGWLEDRFGGVVVLRRAPEGLASRLDGERALDNGGFLLQMLEGVAAYDSIVNVERPVVLGESADLGVGGQTVSFLHRRGGSVVLGFVRGELRRVEYGRPAGGAGGSGQTVDLVRSVRFGARFDDGLFEVVAPVGVRVDDRRSGR